MSKKQPIRVISLFDGMSCGQIALKELGYEVQYYASEIDKHAIAQTQLNFPDTIQLGDVTKWREWDIDWNFDLLLAGSPCQGFSFAGKQLAFNDPRSKLFFVFVDILNHIRKVNPDVKFLLENVRMKAEHEAVITQYTGVNPIYINSALVSAQNRERIYWTNIGMVQRGLFGEWYPGIPQPQDRGILLRDILESEVDEKYYISDAALNRILRRGYSDVKINPDKTGTLNTKNNSPQLSTDSGTTLISDRGTGGSFISTHTGKVGTLSVRNGCSHDNHVIIKPDGKIKPNQQKASCFTAGAHSGGNHSDMDLICVAMRGRGENNEQQLESNNTGKTNCLTSVQKDNLLLIPEATIKGYVEIAEGECFDFENPNSKTRRGRKMEDKSNCLMAQPTTNFMRYEGVQKDNLVAMLKANTLTPDAYLARGTRNRDENGKAVLTSMCDRRIRRLTLIECSRLQTIPDWYQFKYYDKNGKVCNTSDTQVYRQLGNGWTVQVIIHILKHISL